MVTTTRGMRGAIMTGRKCSTCKHYEPAPIWRKGWCRNSLLYAPQQSHLVGEDDLDCERGMGNYWEPALNLADHTGDVRQQAPESQPLHLYPHGVHASRRPVAPPTIYPVSGSSGYGTDPDDDLPPPQRDRISTPGGRERELSYYSDERYWTDYLRIAAPIVGVILILLLFWFWASSFLGDGNDSDDVGAGADATGTRATLPIVGASPETTERAGAANTPIVVLTPTGGPETPGVGGEQPAPGGGEITVGSTVVVANTGAEGVNLRADSSTEAGVVDVLLDGTELTVIGGPIEGETYTWWNVQNESVTGWLVEEFLEVAQ